MTDRERILASIAERHRKVMDRQFEALICGSTSRETEGPASSISAAEIMDMAKRASPPSPSTFGGYQIAQSENALTNHRMVTWFTEPKPSKNRSRRLWKKLRKKSAITTVTGDPAIYQTPQGIVAHPTLFRHLANSAARRIMGK
jgi:hypothetical protein